jgi:hypothetical protein
MGSSEVGGGHDPRVKSYLQPLRCPEASRPDRRAYLSSCGKTGRSITVGLASEVGIASEINARMTPQDHERDWRRVWDRLNELIEELERRETGALSGAAIKTKRDRLVEFFVAAYHLKDLLKESVVPGQEVEDAITADTNLALLADLANLTKHGSLTRPRSGAAPEMGEVHGDQSGSGDGGWQLAFAIRHAGLTYDGLTFARRAIEAWRGHLSGGTSSSSNNVRRLTGRLS